MALKPTIYKFSIELSDLNRNHYDTLNLTVARHPSETAERMMARVMAYCINAQTALSFTQGISAADQPDIVAHTLDDRIAAWIDVGEPGVDRIKKAAKQSTVVKVYCFNPKSTAWWKKGQKQLSELKVSVFQFQWEGIQELAALVQRTLNLTVTISEDTAYVATENEACDLSWNALQVTEGSRGTP